MEVGGQTAGIPFAEASVQVDDRLRALDVTKARTPGLKVLIGCLGEQAADVDVGLASLVLQGTIKRLEWRRWSRDGTRDGRLLSHEELQAG